jgi:hypothetical protein
MTKNRGLKWRALKRISRTELLTVSDMIPNGLVGMWLDESHIPTTSSEYLSEAVLDFTGSQN